MSFRNISIAAVSATPSVGSCGLSLLSSMHRLAARASDTSRDSRYWTWALSSWSLAVNTINEVQKSFSRECCSSRGRVGSPSPM